MGQEIAQYLALDSTLVSPEVKTVPKEGCSSDNSLNILTFPIPQPSKAIQANSHYFNQHKWAKGYFESCHRYKEFKARWQAVMGSWDDKIVVDIGCGPGNLYASLNGSPRVLIGVDVSLGALEMAAELGYTAVLADAHHLPFISGFADIVTMNASLHHCEDMPARGDLACRAAEDLTKAWVAQHLLEGPEGLDEDLLAVRDEEQ